jgi:signal transduction histidine kinase
VALEVVDDGRGFDLARVRHKGGLGLVSMQERAERIGGQFSIHTAPGEGTTVKLSVQQSAVSNQPSETNSES